MKKLRINELKRYSVMRWHMIVALVLISLCGKILAQEERSNNLILQMDAVQEEFDLINFGQLWVNPPEKVDINSVLDGRLEIGLIPIYQPASLVKKTLIPQKGGWIRFEIKSNLEKATEWQFFPISRITSIDKTRVFLSNPNGSWDEKLTGRLIPNSQKDVPGFASLNIRKSQYGVSLKIIPGEIKTIWVYYQNRSGPRVQFQPLLQSKEFFITQNERFWSWRNLIQGLFYGMMAMILLFSLLRWIIRKDKTYLMYALFILSLIFIAMGLPGIRMYQVFIPEHPLIGDFLSLISEYTVVIFFILFIRDFLNLKKLLKGWSKIIKWMLFLYIGILIIRIFFYLFSLYEHIAYVVNLWLYLLVFSLLLFLFLRLIQTGNVLARYIIIGSGILVFGGVIHVLEILEFIHLPLGNSYLEYPSVYLLEGAIVIELITFSLGLGYRTRNIEREKNFIEAKKEQQTKYFENVSHEIKSPLSLIYSAVEDLSWKQDYQKDLSKLQIIERSSDKIRKLVSDLLTLARIDAGHINLRASKTDLGKFVSSLCPDFKLHASHHEILLEFFRPEKPVYAFIDIEKTEMILSNLVSNAIKNTPKGNKISVNIINDPENREVGISVWNQGKGIPPQHIDKIFLRFFSLDHKKGSGIGLSLCKELVELQKGKITVHSQESHGTLFEFRVPMGSNHLLPEEITELSHLEVKGEKIISPFLIGPDKEFPMPKTGKSILIVEDDQDLRKGLGIFLENNGYEVLEAMDGEEGFSLAKKNIPNLIITDMWMPRKTGLELTSLLKRDELTSHIPIILLTVEKEQKKIISSLEQGVALYLPKPVQFKMLLAYVVSLIKNTELLIDRYGHEEFFDKIPGPEVKFIRKVEKIIEERLDDETLKASNLHKPLLMSRSQLHKKLEAITGLNTSHFLSRYRLKQGKKLLHDQDITVSEVSVTVGFRNSSYFIKKFKEQYFVTPNEYKKSLKS